MLTMKPQADRPATYFQKRWSWYNQSVNFEHICFIVAYVLTGDVHARDNDLEYLLFPFLYFITKYREYKDELVHFVYHIFKLIRIYFTRSVDPNSKFWNPTTYMTNLRFGCYIDPNVEIYGNIRLGTNPNSFMSMFSNAPRSTADTNEKVVWFNWNDITPIIFQFTRKSNDIWKSTFGNKAPGRGFKSLWALFDFLTKKDVLPRSRLVKNDCINLYHRCVIDKETELKDEILTQTLINFLCEKNFADLETSKKLNDCRVGITYFEGEYIKSKALNITLLDLAKCVRYKKVEKTEDEKCVLIPYIVKCHLGLDNHIHREECKTSDWKFKELLEIINKTRNEIEASFE